MGTVLLVIKVFSKKFSFLYEIAKCTQLCIEVYTDGEKYFWMEKPTLVRCGETFHIQMTCFAAHAGKNDEFTSK